MVINCFSMRYVSEAHSRENNAGNGKTGNKTYLHLILKPPTRAEGSRQLQRYETSIAVSLQNQEILISTLNVRSADAQPVSEVDFIARYQWMLKMAI